MLFNGRQCNGSILKIWMNCLNKHRVAMISLLSCLLLACRTHQIATPRDALIAGLPYMEAATVCEAIAPEQSHC